MHPSVILDPTTSTTSGATPRLRSRLRLAGAALATLLLLGLAQPPAWAHDQLLSSTPAGGNAVTALPPEIVLTLSEAPLATGAQVVITAADGSMVSTGTASVDEATATVTVPVTGEGPAGAYTVAWHVVSSDGHPIEGAFEFSLEPTGEASDKASPSTTGTAETDPDPESTGAATAQDAQETTSPASQGLAATTDSHDDGLTSDPLLVVGSGIAIAVAILVVVAYVTRRRDHSPEPADTAGPDAQE